VLRPQATIACIVGILVHTCITIACIGYNCMHRLQLHASVTTACIGYNCMHRLQLHASVTTACIGYNCMHRLQLHASVTTACIGILVHTRIPQVACVKTDKAMLMIQFAVSSPLPSVPCTSYLYAYTRALGVIICPLCVYGTSDLFVCTRVLVRMCIRECWHGYIREIQHKWM
jgi:hypothetical protein